MRRWIGWTTLATFVVAIVTHVIAVTAIPYDIMDDTMNVQFGSLERNKVVHGQPKTAADRTVVMPSPDLLYSIILYDVSQNPLRITAKVPETYWSVSFYALNTDNYYIVNNKQAKSNPVELLLVGKNKPCPDPGNAQVVVAPSDRGIVLFRLFITEEKSLPDLVKIQKQASCREEGRPGEQPAVKPPSEGGLSSETAVYRDADYGFSVEYPKDWVQKETKGSQVLYAAAPDRVPVITASIRNEAAFADALSSALKEAGNVNIKLGPEGQATLSDGTPATQVKLTFKVSAGYPAEALSLGVQKNGKWVLVTVTTVTLLLPYDEAKFSEITHSLKFE